MAATSRIDRPRSLVSHIKHLADVDPVEARKFIDGSCDAARKRLGLRPAETKRTKRTARHGRHVVVATITDPVTGEERVKTARRRKAVRVYRYTADQVKKILAEAKPRKAEYKEIRTAALEALTSKEQAPKLRMRHLPRHTKWSKRRHRR